MNIAIFTPNQNPYSETFIQAHKKYLKGKVLYYYGQKHIQLEGSSSLVSKNKRRFLNIQKRILKKPFSFIQETIILNSLKKNKIDIVLAEYGTHAHLILPIIKKAGLPLVVHFHGYDASVRRVIEQHNQYKGVFQYASKVIAVSKKMKQMLLEIGCPKEKLVYNVYGPQPEFMDVQPKYSQKQVIGIGRFTDKKAPYYTLLAFKKVLLKHPDARLVLAGEGKLFNMCKNLSKYLNIEDNVTLPGVITPEKYRELLSVSIGFVQHSITAENGDMEGTPLAILEASAAGIPVISTYHAGIPDVIIHGETGLLCQEHDVEGMANNICRLLDEKKLAQTLGTKGKKRIQENFSLTRHIDELQRILKAAVQ